MLIETNEDGLTGTWFVKFKKCEFQLKDKTHCSKPQESGSDDL